MGRFCPRKPRCQNGKASGGCSSFSSPLPQHCWFNVLGCVPGEQMYYCMVSPPHIMAVSSTDFAHGHFLIQQLTWPQVKNKIRSLAIANRLKPSAALSSISSGNKKQNLQSSSVSSASTSQNPIPSSSDLPSSSLQIVLGSRRSQDEAVPG